MKRVATPFLLGAQPQEPIEAFLSAWIYLP